MSDRLRVLFVRTHNPARSHVAEGFVRALGRDRFDVESAGIGATRVRPFAIQAMAEAGVDISLHESKTIDRLLPQRFAASVAIPGAIRKRVESELLQERLRAA